MRDSSLKTEQNTETLLMNSVHQFSMKGGDPAAPSDTATLLRLHPNHLSHLRRLAPKVTPPTSGVTNSWCDGRCVQGPGTYSPRHADAITSDSLHVGELHLQSELRTVL